MIGERRFWGCDNPVTSVRSHNLEVPWEDTVSNATSLVRRELVWKLMQEHERLRRLLPDPPVGYHWEFEVVQSENLIADTIIYREHAVLKEDV